MNGAFFSIWLVLGAVLGSEARVAEPRYFDCIFTPQSFAPLRALPGTDTRMTNTPEFCLCHEAWCRVREAWCPCLRRTVSAPEAQPSDTVTTSRAGRGLGAVAIICSALLTLALAVYLINTHGLTVGKERSRRLTSYVDYRRVSYQDCRMLSETHGSRPRGP